MKSNTQHRFSQPILWLATLLTFALTTTFRTHAAETVWLDSLDLTSMHQGWGAPQVNRSIREQPLSIGGQKFERDQCARVVKLDDETFLMVKDLADGTKAVGLCNLGEDKVSITAKWSDIGVKGKQPVRDLWRQKNRGKFIGEFKADVPRRGVVMVKVGKR